MTRDELLATLREQAENGDTEDAHHEADAAPLDYINDPEIRAAYDAVEKWYA